MQLRALRPGDCAVFLPGGSKADFAALEFGTRPVYLPFVDTITNAARNLALLELQLPVHGPQRAREPLLPVSADRRSLCHKLADTLFQLLAEKALGAAVAATLSLHSGRVWLACALAASGHAPPAIQAFCRWKSAESVKVYARMNPTEYAATLLGVMEAEITSISPHNLPTLDHDARFAALSDDVGDDDGLAASAQSGASTAPVLALDQPRQAPPRSPSASATPSLPPTQPASPSPSPTSERKRRATRVGSEATSRGSASRRRGPPATAAAAPRR